MVRRAKRKGIQYPLREFYVRFLGTRPQSNDVTYNRPLLPPGSRQQNLVVGGDSNILAISGAFPQHAARYSANFYFPDLGVLIANEAIFAVHDPLSFKLYFYKIYSGLVDSTRFLRHPHFAMRLKKFGIIDGVKTMDAFKGHVRATIGEFIDRPGSGIVSAPLDTDVLSSQEEESLERSRRRRINSHKRRNHRPTTPIRGARYDTAYDDECWVQHPQSQSSAEISVHSPTMYDDLYDGDISPNSLATTPMSSQILQAANSIARLSSTLS